MRAGTFSMSMIGGRSVVGEGGGVDNNTTQTHRDTIRAGTVSMSF